MSFIGRQLAEGAYSGFLGKIDEFIAFLSDEPLPEDIRANYQRITQSALRAVNCYIGKGKTHLTSATFSKDVEKITTRALQGVGSASRKFFMGKTKGSFQKGKKTQSPISGFMHQAQSILCDIGSMAQKEVKKQLLSFFSHWIIDGIDIALDSFKSKDADYKALKKKVDASKEAMLSACREGDFKDILSALKEMTKAVEDAPIYFNGIPLLRTSQVEDSGILKGIANTKALKELTRKKILKEQEKLVTVKGELETLAKNLAIQNTVNIIFPSILDQSIPSLEAIYENPRLHLATKHLHKLIQESSAPTLKKWIAHLSVSFVMHFFYHVLDYAFEQLEKKISRFINHTLDDSLNFSNVASLFSKLNAAHLSIKDQKDYFGTIDELVAKNMEKEQLETSAKLYERVQTKFLNEFSLKLPLTRIFWRKIWHVSLNSLLLDIIVFPLKFTLCLFSWLLLILPELIINFVLSHTLRISFFWKKTLPTLILKSLTSFSDYTKSIHPINLMMVDHLQKIWNGLKSTYIDHEEPIDHAKKLPPATKQSLDLTLRHLFELLEKTPFETPEQLIHYFEGRSPLEKTKITASKFFLSQNLSAFTSMIAQAINVTMSKESKQKILTQALVGINQGFSKKQTLTIKQMGETEEKINILLSQILSLTIRKTIEHRYNFTPKNQAETTDRFLKEIKEKTKKASSDWLPILDTLSLDHEIADIATRIELFCDFIQNKQLEIRSNPELPKNPRALINQWYCEPIQEKIAVITAHIENLSFLRQLHKDESLLKKKLQKLSLAKGFSLKEIIKLQEEAWLIYKSSDPLHAMQPHLEELFEKMQTHILIQKIKNQLETLNHSSDAEQFMDNLETIIESSLSSSSIHALLTVFKHTLKELPLSQLKSKQSQISVEMQTKLDICNVEISQMALDILESFPDSDLKSLITPDSKKAAWSQIVIKLKSHVQELETLSEEFKPIEHYNIKLISTDDALELMQNFAYGCMIGPMEQLLKLIKKPYIWQYGIVNGLCREFLE
jgi:hypothetical protein